MKTTVQLDFPAKAVIFLSAWLISLAWRPMWDSPISPCISALGTRAATESIITMSMAPERTMVSAISRACSPSSGWERYMFAVSTPRFLAYIGSRACSASIYPAIPPIFCTSATRWRAIVVLPEDSGPYISIILPLGMPPTPRGNVKAETACRYNVHIGRCRTVERCVTAPFPYCFSM